MAWPRQCPRPHGPITAGRKREGPRLKGGRARAAKATEGEAGTRGAVEFRGGIPTVTSSPEQRRRELTGELAVVNARLTGQDPATAKRRVEWLRRQRDAWAKVVEHVTASEADVTLDEVERLHARVEGALSSGEQNAKGASRREELERLRNEVRIARERASELGKRTQETATRIKELEEQATDERTEQVGVAEPGQAEVGGQAREEAKRSERRGRKGISRRFADERSLCTPSCDTPLANHWYPVAFVNKVQGKRMKQRKEVELMGRRYVVHERNGELKCEDVKTGKELDVRLAEGMVWAWPGTREPEEWKLEEEAGRVAVPDGHVVQAELEMEVPVEHGLLIENLADLAHAPFTHTETFAKGWEVPELVTFACRAASAEYGVEGTWSPYPIQMEFAPPCLVESLIGISQPGASGGGASFTSQTPSECPRKIHQVHACLPAHGCKTFLLYRLSLDFARWLRFVPGMRLVWRRMAEQVLEEDRRLVQGQQDRMLRGGRVWANPVEYDIAGLHYRRWRNQAQKLEFSRPYD